MHELWPEIPPFDQGLLAVGAIHKVHYALYGNPKGVPVIFLRDVICPPMLAWRLHRRLPKSRLILVKNGAHLASDPEIQRTLLDSVKGWASYHL